MRMRPSQLERKIYANEMCEPRGHRDEERVANSKGRTPADYGRLQGEEDDLTNGNKSILFASSSLLTHKCSKCRLVAIVIVYTFGMEQSMKPLLGWHI